MEKEFTAYMCKTDFDYDARSSSKGTKIYPNEKALREYKSCVDECGIVKVKVSLEEIIQEENWNDLLK